MSDLLDFMEQKGMQPKVISEKGEALCPSGEKEHHLNFDLGSETWHCTICTKKGTRDDLQRWFWELDQKRLSKFMKEINEDGSIQSEETLKWWMNRY